MDETKPQSWTRRVLEQHPALLVSLLYFMASLIGVVYSWAFLGGFGINVFSYADVSDFLLASLKEPLTWVLTLGAMALVASDNVMSIRVQRKGPNRWLRWYGHPRYRQVNYLIMLLLSGVTLFVFALEREETIRDGNGELVSVLVADAATPKQRVMLGTTARYVFLFDPQTERVDIHPHESIAMITKPSPDRRDD